MIEFALLFALGFLSAAVLGLMVYPAVRGRIMRFAEKRLKATMPMSPQEVRAQKDAARAVYAVETAKAHQNLDRQRRTTVELMLTNETRLQEARRLSGENAELQVQIGEMNVEAADLRSSLRALDQLSDRFKITLSLVERDNEAKRQEIALLLGQLDRVSADVDSLRIDLAARTTEADNLRSRISRVRDERDGLRREANARDARLKEIEAHFAREQMRLRQMEERLAVAVAAGADKESALNRQAMELERLKAIVLANGPPWDGAVRALPDHDPGIHRNEGTAGEHTPFLSPRQGEETVLTTKQEKAAPLVAGQPRGIAARDERVRNRAAAVFERLKNARTDAHDDALRTEIAEIAAKMIALTAAKEGQNSPLHALLGHNAAPKATDRLDLAARAKEEIAPAP